MNWKKQLAEVNLTTNPSVIITIFTIRSEVKDVIDSQIFSNF